MAINLLDLIGKQLTSNTTSSIASFLGESQSATRSGIEAILPTILGGLVSNGSTKSGAEGLLDMINKGNHDGSIFDNLSGILSGGSSTSSLTKIGGSVLSSIFGNKQNSILDKIISITGLGRNSSSSLMSMLAPMVIGMIGKQVKKSNLGVSGLMDLLLGQKSFLKSALPSGMGSMLGFADFNKSTTSYKKETVVEDNGGNGWWKWVLGALLLGGLLWFFLRPGTSEKIEDTVDTSIENTKDALNNAGDAIKSASNYTVDAAGNLVDATGKVIKRAGEFTRDAAGNFVDAAGNAIRNVGDAIDDAANYTLDAAGNLVDKAGNVIKKAGTFTRDASGRIVDNVAELESNTYTVDTDGNLIDNKGVIVFKSGDFSTDEEGYYVDKKGNRIGRVLKKIGKAVANAADKTADAFTNTFNNLFKKKESTGTTYTLSAMQWKDNSHRISYYSKPEVEGLVAALKANPDAKIKVQAYTDDAGSKSKNKELSEMRAKVIRDIMVALGTSKDQISSKGMSAKDEVKAAIDKIEIIVE